jgi:hypothetical protein
LPFVLARLGQLPGAGDPAKPLAAVLDANGLHSFQFDAILMSVPELTIRQSNFSLRIKDLADESEG